MTAERGSMTLQEMDAPALGVEERRDEAPGAGASHARPTPDPEVVAKPKRRKFTAQYRLRILEEAESCTQPGEVGRLLRREGLYSSHLTEWRRARREGSLQGLILKIERGGDAVQVRIADGKPFDPGRGLVLRLPVRLELFVNLVNDRGLWAGHGGRVKKAQATAGGWMTPSCFAPSTASSPASPNAA